MSISTYALATATRLSILKQQIQLSDAQKEISTLRKADVGRDLGALTTHSLHLRQEYSRLESLVDHNSLAQTRLNTSQGVLGAVLDLSKSVLGATVSLRGQVGQASKIVIQAQQALSSLENQMNTSVGGEYIFAGINTDMTPLIPGLADPNSPQRQAVEQAFVTYFGFSTTSSQVETISPTQMQSFLDTSFSALFSDPSWGTLWSGASDQAIKSRVSAQELLDTSVTATEPGVRDSVKGYLMLTALGLPKTNAQTFDVLLKNASEALGKAGDGVVHMQTTLGFMQAHIEEANTRMGIQKHLLNQSIQALEASDPYEASMKVSALLNQIEASYALTAKIQKLSLLDYMR